MGLDQFLTRRTYVKNWPHMQDWQLHKISISGPNAKGINVDRVSYIEEELFRWRKANHLHKWFMNKANRNGKVYVNEELLEELRDTIQEVLDDRSKAEELLPCQEGFFFGGQSFDEYYWQTNQETLDFLNKFIKEISDNILCGDIYYEASW